MTTATVEKRITLATIKSFINKNRDDLLIKVGSRFDGMTDCVEQVEDNFSKAQVTEFMSQHTLGIQGAWFVGNSRDHFSAFETDDLKGFEVYNACGSFILATAK